MKLVWSPETASKAYLETVQALAGREDFDDTDVAELVAAMAGGWRAQLIVEAWSRGSSPATSVALATATRYTNGRRVRIVEDNFAATECRNSTGSGAAEVTITESNSKSGEHEQDEEGRVVEGVDFMVVDCRRRDAWQVVRSARAGPRGMVVVRTNVSRSTSSMAAGKAAVGPGKRVVRSVFLPIGRGVEILHVGVGKGPSDVGRSRWIKYVDRDTGEEHVFKRDLRCRSP